MVSEQSDSEPTDPDTESEEPDEEHDHPEVERYRNSPGAAVARDCDVVPEPNEPG